MTINEKINHCQAFYTELCNLLANTYEVLASCNNDISSYLVPKGTSDQVTYHSKPAKSFRISDHWNWYANLNKCENPRYIQCLSVDVPWAKKRIAEGKASKPIFAIQVSYIESDGKYHCVYGEKFDPKTKKWSWVEADPVSIVNSL